MALWKNDNGEDYSKSENDLIDRVLSELTPPEKTMYEIYVIKIRDLFVEMNKTKCANCTKDLWNDRLKNGSPNDRGCCVRCAGNKGYFGSFHYDWFIFDKVKKKKYYDRVNGFFDTSKMQCSLPRQLRSSTCLAYACDYEIWGKARSLCQIVDQLRNLQYKRSSGEEVQQ